MLRWHQTEKYRQAPVEHLRDRASPQESVVVARHFRDHDPSLQHRNLFETRYEHMHVVGLVCPGLASHSRGDFYCRFCYSSIPFKKHRFSSYRIDKERYLRSFLFYNIP